MVRKRPGRPKKNTTEPKAIPRRRTTRKLKKGAFGSVDSTKKMAAISANSSGKSSVKSTPKKPSPIKAVKRRTNVAPRSGEQFKIGPKFHETQQYCELYITSTDRTVEPILNARIDRGFDLIDGQWIGYKRNYFSLVATFELFGFDQTIFMNEKFHIINLDGMKLNVECFAIRISSECLDKSIEVTLVQHTAKRDKGPHFVSPVYACVSGVLPDHETIRDSANIRNQARIEELEKLLYLDEEAVENCKSHSILTTYPDQKICTVAKYERMQFCTSANYRKVVGITKNFVLKVELLAVVGSGNYTTIASIITPFLEVRGRSPSNYKKPTSKEKVPEKVPEKAPEEVGVTGNTNTADVKRSKVLKLSGIIRQGDNLYDMIGKQVDQSKRKLDAREMLLLSKTKKNPEPMVYADNSDDTIELNNGAHSEISIGSIFKEDVQEENSNSAPQTYMVKIKIPLGSFHPEDFQNSEELIQNITPQRSEFNGIKLVEPMRFSFRDESDVTNESINNSMIPSIENSYGNAFFNQLLNNVDAVVGASSHKRKKRKLKSKHSRHNHKRKHGKHKHKKGKVERLEYEYNNGAELENAIFLSPLNANESHHYSF